MELRVAAILGAAVGVVHTALTMRHRVTLRHRLWPVFLGLGAIAVAAAIWFISVELSPYQERLWWASITGFVVASGLVNLAWPANRRTAARR